MAKTHTYPAVVFDLDGTLLDTWPSLLESVRAIATSSAALDSAALRMALSQGIAPMIGVAAKQVDEYGDTQSFAAFVDDVLTHYNKNTLLTAIPFEGVGDALRTLFEAGYSLAICTNRDRDSTLKLLDHYGWKAYFRHVHCLDDGLPAKPHPDALRHVVTQLGHTPETAVFIGDSYVDAECAHAASIQFAGHRGGYHTRLEELQPAALTYTHVGELMQWLDR